MNSAIQHQFDSSPHSSMKVNSNAVMFGLWLRAVTPSDINKVNFEFSCIMGRDFSFGFGYTSMTKKVFFFSLNHRRSRRYCHLSSRSRLGRHFAEPTAYTFVDDFRPIFLLKALVDRQLTRSFVNLPVAFAKSWS